MSSVLTQISPGRSADSLHNTISLEAAIAEHTELVDQHLGEIADAHGELREHVAEVNNGDQAATGIAALTDSMIAAAGEDGLDEVTVKAYSDSLEALLSATGIMIPAEAFIPSFESGSHFSFEAEEKKENVLTRVFKWLAEAFSKFVEMVRSFFSRIWTTIPSLRKLATALKVKVGKLTGAPTKGGDIPFGGQAQYLVDENGVIHKPDAIINKVVLDYKKYLDEWQTLWAGFAEMDVPDLHDSKSVAAFGIHSAQVIETMNGKMNAKHSFNFLPAFSITATPGSDKKKPVLGVKVKVEKSSVQVKSGAVTPTPSELRSGIDGVLGAIDGLEKVKKIIDNTAERADKNAKALQYFKVEAKIQEAKELAELINESLPAFRSGLVAMTVGYADTMPHYLQSVRAVLKYISAGAKRYSAGEASTDKLDNYEPAKDDSKANTYEHKPD